MGGFLSAYIILKDKEERAYLSGWNAAKGRLYEIGVLERNEIDYPVRSVAGTVENIEKNRIYLKIIPVEALADKDLDDRVAIIDDKTKIYEYERKNEADIEEEREKLKAKGVFQEPELYEKKEVSISELQTKASVVVNTLEDVRNEKQFIASEIIIRR